MSATNRALMPLKLALTTAIFIILPLSQTADAMLMSRDSNWGTGSITLDTNSGLEWLDISLSVNLSYNDMISHMQNGGLYAGFRYATQDEVEALFINAGLNMGSSPAMQSALDLIGFLGATYTSRGNAEIFGITGTSSASGVESGIVDHVFSNGTPMYDASVSELTYGMDYNSSSVGNWLVSSGTSEVPLPPALVLFGSALALTGFIKRVSNRLG